MLIDHRVEQVNRSWDENNQPVIKEGDCTYAVIDLGCYSDPRLDDGFNQIDALLRDTWNHQRLCIEAYDRRWRHGK